jgi:hypothetical protein
MTKMRKFQNIIASLFIIQFIRICPDALRKPYFEFGKNMGDIPFIPYHVICFKNLTYTIEAEPQRLFGKLSLCPLLGAIQFFSSYFEYFNSKCFPVKNFPQRSTYTP